MADTLKEIQAAADAALQKAAAYVAAVQPVIDKHNEDHEKFVKRAHQMAGVLAGRGIINKSKLNGLVEKIAADPCLALELVEKVAGMVENEKMGSASDVESTNKQFASSFDRVLFGQGEHGSSMVD